MSIKQERVDRGPVTRNNRSLHGIFRAKAGDESGQAKGRAQKWEDRMMKGQNEIKIKMFKPGLLRSSLLALFALCVQGCDSRAAPRGESKAEGAQVQASPGLAKRGSEMALLPQEKQRLDGPTTPPFRAKSAKLEIAPPIGFLKGCMFGEDTPNATSIVEPIHSSGQLPRYRVQLDFTALRISLEPLVLRTNCSVQLGLDWTPGYRVAVRKITTLARPEVNGKVEKEEDEYSADKDYNKPIFDMRYDLANIHGFGRTDRFELASKGPGTIRLTNYPDIQTDCKGSGRWDADMKLRLDDPSSPEPFDIKVTQVIVEFELVKPPADDKECEKEKGGSPLPTP